MSIVMQINPFEFFADTHGDALDAGFIWIGEINKDPIQYPVAAFYDEALTIPAPMPLRTTSGYIVRNGSPTFLYINGNYSILVQDREGRQIYYVPDFLLIGNDSAVSQGDFDQFKADLANTTDIALGDAMIGVKQPVSGARGQTQHDKNAQELHIDDFEPLPANTLLSRAIDGTPDGWVLKLGKGPYIANFSKSRNNITLQGLGAPEPLADRSALSGTGTIIQGKLRFSGSGVTVKDLGVDCGVTVCNAINGGAAMDGLVISNSTTPQSNNHARNIVSLCKSPTDLVHANLFENFSKGTLVNIKGYQGFVGVVVKCQDVFWDQLAGYRNSNSGIQFKSNSYAVFARCEGGSAYASDEGLNLANSVGIFIYAEDAQLQRLVATSLTTTGFATGVGVFLTAGQALNDCHLGAITCNNSTTYGVTSFGGIVECSTGPIKVSNPTSGRGVRINEDCLGLIIESIQVSTPAASDLDDCVYLGGVTTCGPVTNTQQYLPTVNPGITIVPSAAAPRAWRLGNYIGRLNLNQGVAGYRNGWATAVLAPANQPGGIRYGNGVARMKGRLLVPPLPWAGKELCYQFNTALAPSVPHTFYVGGFTAAGTADFMVQVLVNTDGTITVVYLNTVAKFPASITDICLNGITWDVSV